jgi:hypothetical protein
VRLSGGNGVCSRRGGAIEKTGRAGRCEIGAGSGKTRGETTCEASR